MSELVVAVDGPAGSGKSSVSKAVAKSLGFGYLDTGASYRALTLTALNNRWDLASVGTLTLADLFPYKISTDPNHYWVRVGESDVTEAIRSAEVEMNVSKVASQPKVRDFMREQTRRLVRECERPGIVVEGRDITSVVLPNANCRVLLTASEEVRVARRARELGVESNVDTQVSNRDQQDSRVVDFLTPAQGVELLDTSKLSFDDSVEQLLSIISRCLGKLK